MLPRPTSLTILFAAASFLVLPQIPGLGQMPGLGASQLVAAFLPRLPQKPVPPEPEPEAAPGDTGPHSAAPHLVVAAHSLDRFFGDLRTGGTVRVLHYGDSPTTADSITSGVRRLLQKRFGDSGHGFLLIAPPWAWYGHAGTQLSATGWKIEAASQARAADHIHGLGGVNFRGAPGATSHVTLSAYHSSGLVYYLAEPGGGAFTLSAGETELINIQTDAPEKAVASAEFHMPEGEKSIELRVTQGQPRLFGYRFDKDQPGVQYSSLGVNGAQVQMIVRSFEPGQWKAALEHEKPSLVILNYGTNESIYPAYIDKEYPNELRAVIHRLRDALPESSILIMSPMDRGVRNSSGEIETPDALIRLVAVQRRIAEETGCAFFNTFEAMGGAGTMGRWYEMQPRLVSGDFIHPLPQGTDKVAEVFVAELMQAFGDPQ